MRPLLPSPRSAASLRDSKHCLQQPHSPSRTVRAAWFKAPNEALLLDKNSATARSEWQRHPQEAHVLDAPRCRFRRLTGDEIAVLQSFPSSWAAQLSLRPRIRGLGNAVPPRLAFVLVRELDATLRRQGRGIDCHVELFAGFGGFALGAYAALHRGVLGSFSSFPCTVLIDSWPTATRVLREAGVWNERNILTGDARDFMWPARLGTLDLLTGGPPCQPWSNAGAKQGVADERDCLNAMPSIIAKSKPRAFLLENVPGLTSSRNAAFFDMLMERLASSGGETPYAVGSMALNAADFGVPQLRKRVFVVGFLGARQRVVEDFFDRVRARRTHGPERKPWRTIADALPNWADDSLDWYEWPLR